MDRTTKPTALPPTLAALVAWGALSACTSTGPAAPEPTDAGGATVEGGEFSIATSLSPVIPTVATVTWSLAGAGALDEARIEFGESGSTDRMTAPVQVDGPGPYSSVLVGMKPSRPYCFRIVARTALGTIVSPEQDITTGGLPGGLPRITIEAADVGRHARGFVLSTLFAAPVAAVIFDANGDFVWWYPRTPTLGKMLLGRARMSPDRQWIYMWGVHATSAGVVGTDDPDTGSPEQKLVKVRLDGSDEEVVPLPYGHHDFTFLPDGTVAYIEYDTRVIDGAAVAGDRLAELQPDGTEVDVYTVWNDFQYDGSDPTAGEGWCHANFLDYHVDRGVYDAWQQGLPLDPRDRPGHGQAAGRAGRQPQRLHRGDGGHHAVRGSARLPARRRGAAGLRHRSPGAHVDPGRAVRGGRRCQAADADVVVHPRAAPVQLQHGQCPAAALRQPARDLLDVGADRRGRRDRSAGVAVEPGAGWSPGGALGYAVWKESLYD